MKPKQSYTRRWGHLSGTSIAMLCAALIVTGSPPCHAQPSDSGAGSDASTARIPDEQLDSLVAPIALYPDPLLAQVLAASTYPLEIVQLQQWLERNPGLKDQALVDAVEKQPWDTSVQAMAPLPDMVKRLADDIQWTTDLGNAFLAQQNDLMNAVQRMRQKAQANGNLQTTEQQTVETKVIENKSVIIIEQASPQVVYVPSYNPTVVYGAPPPAYPYPPIYYPPPGYYAAGMALSFGLGVAMGAAWNGGWGNCGWGGDNDVNINNTNNFNRNTVARGGDRGAHASPRGGSGKWQHNPQHRGGAPYGDRGTANRFGGNARGDSMSKRQASARQQVGRQGGNVASTREAGRGGGRNASARDTGGSRAGSPSQGMGGGRAGSPSQGVGGRSASGPDRVGSRNMGSGAGGGGRNDGFGGGRGGYNGASARAASNRGASSMGSRGGFGGGGGRGGGGFGGGGGRGGGGGGRGGGGRR